MNIFDTATHNEEIVMSTEKVLNIVSSIPYDNLIIALVLYALGMFGIEGTRSIISSMDLKGVSEKAKNMPKYKRNRLIQMLFTFMFLAIVSMAFQMRCVNISKVDFHSGHIYAGIGVFMTLLSYADFAPKLSKEVTRFIYNRKKEEEKT